MVKLVIFNELSNARNPNNMQVLHTVLQHSPEQAPKVEMILFFTFRRRLELMSAFLFWLLNSPKITLFTQNHFPIVSAVLGHGVPGPINQ